MGKEKTIYKTKEKMKRSEIGEFLHRLADKITEGRVDLGEGESGLLLQLPESLKFEVEVEDKEKKKGTRHKLELELKWYDDAPEEERTPEQGTP